MIADESIRAVSASMLRDIVACRDYPAFCAALALVPPGPDVEALEHRQSHRRLARVEPIAERLAVLGSLAGDVMYAVGRVSSPGCGNEDEDAERRRSCRAFAHAVSVVVISSLADSGHLEVSARE